MGLLLVRRDDEQMILGSGNGRGKDALISDQMVDMAIEFN